MKLLIIMSFLISHTLYSQESGNPDQYFKVLEGKLSKSLGDVKISPKSASNFEVPEWKDDAIKVWDNRNTGCFILLDESNKFIEDRMVIGQNGERSLNPSDLGFSPITIDSKPAYIVHSDNIDKLEKSSGKADLGWTTQYIKTNSQCPNKGPGINIFGNVTFIYIDKSVTYITKVDPSLRFYLLRDTATNAVVTYANWGGSHHHGTKMYAKFQISEIKKPKSVEQEASPDTVLACKEIDQEIAKLDKAIQTLEFEIKVKELKNKSHASKTKKIKKIQETRAMKLERKNTILSKLPPVEEKKELVETFIDYSSSHGPNYRPELPTYLNISNESAEMRSPEKTSPPNIVIDFPKEK